MCAIVYIILCTCVIYTYAMCMSAVNMACLVRCSVCTACITCVREWVISMHG